MTQHTESSPSESGTDEPPRQAHGNSPALEVPSIGAPATGGLEPPVIPPLTPPTLGSPPARLEVPIVPDAVRPEPKPAPSDVAVRGEGKQPDPADANANDSAHAATQAHDARLLRRDLQRDARDGRGPELDQDQGQQGLEVAAATFVESGEAPLSRRTAEYHVPGVALAASSHDGDGDGDEARSEDAGDEDEQSAGVEGAPARDGQSDGGDDHIASVMPWFDALTVEDVRGERGNISPEKLARHFGPLKPSFRGEMGPVFRALNQETGTLSLVTVFDPPLELGRDDEELAQTVKRFSHYASKLTRAQGRALETRPHVRDLLDFVHADHGVTYTEVSWADGISSRDWMSAQGPLPWSVVSELTRQLLAGLYGLHHFRTSSGVLLGGVVHGNLTPRNCCLEQFDGDDFDASAIPALDIVHFGVGGVSGRPADRLDRIRFGGRHESYRAIGNPIYMAPELLVPSPEYLTPSEEGATPARDLQAWKDRYSPRVDVYAAAVIICEMLAGEAPFSSVADDPKQALHELMAQKMAPCDDASAGAWRLPDVLHLPAGLPRGLQGILQRALHPLPNRRFASVKHFWQAIQVIDPSLDGDLSRSSLRERKPRSRAVLAPVALTADQSGSGETAQTAHAVRERETESGDRGATMVPSGGFVPPPALGGSAAEFAAQAESSQAPEAGPVAARDPSDPEGSGEESPVKRSVVPEIRPPERTERVLDWAPDRPLPEPTSEHAVVTDTVDEADSGDSSAARSAWAAPVSSGTFEAPEIHPSTSDEMPSSESSSALPIRTRIIAPVGVRSTDGEHLITRELPKMSEQEAVSSGQAAERSSSVTLSFEKPALTRDSTPQEVPSTQAPGVGFGSLDVAAQADSSEPRSKSRAWLFGVGAVAAAALIALTFWGGSEDAGKPPGQRVAKAGAGPNDSAPAAVQPGRAGALAEVPAAADRPSPEPGRAKPAAGAAAMGGAGGVVEASASGSAIANGDAEGDDNAAEQGGGALLAQAATATDDEEGGDAQKLAAAEMQPTAQPVEPPTPRAASAQARSAAANSDGSAPNGRDAKASAGRPSTKSDTTEGRAAKKPVAAAPERAARGAGKTARAESAESSKPKPKRERRAARQSRGSKAPAQPSSGESPKAKAPERSNSASPQQKRRAERTCARRITPAKLCAASTGQRRDYYARRFEDLTAAFCNRRDPKGSVLARKKLRNCCEARQLGETCAD